MSTYSRVKSWSSNETLTSTDLNAEFNNIITNTNSGNLNSDNVSTSATWTWTGTHTMSTSSKLALIDNIYLTLGSATDGDYFLRYSASNTALELSTTNADGSGTNAVVVDIQDGTDDVRVRGGLSTDNNTAPTTGLKVGGNIVSDTDSTDDLGTTSVRWANVYTDAVGDSGQTLGVKATTLSFDAASTIDTSGNNALTLDAGSAVLTLDGGTLESDATTLSFDSAATIDTSGNNALSLDAGSAVLTLDGGTLESDASTFSFDAAATIDTSGNNNLTLSAGTGTLVATAGDMTLFDDNNNADVSLSLGTSATEALVVQALNGGSNKTLEELRITTKTASGTAQHGKISFHIDEVNIGNINDDGITLESGKVLTGNVTGNASGTAATVTSGTQAAITTCANLTTVGTVTTGTWSGVIDGSATMTLGSDATGDIYYRDASGFLERLASGADGYVLTGTGAGSIPAWESLPSSGISWDGSTANGVATYKDGDEATVESNLTFDGSTLAVTGGMTLSSTSTISGDMTFNDNVKVTLGTGGDADLYYDGTDVVLDPSVAGTGNFVVQVASSGADPNVKGLMVENSSSAAMTIGTGSTSEGMLHFADSEAANSGRIVYAHNENDMYFCTAATERMRLDSAGNMILGGTTTTTNWTASGKFFIEGAIPGIGLRDTTGSADDWMIVNSNGTLTIANDTDNTQPVVITDAGLVHIGDSDAPSDYLDVSISSSGGRAARFTQKNSSGNILALEYSGVSPDNNTQNFLITSDGTAVRNYIYSDGDVWTADAGTLTSDERLKTNIVDASDKLADLMRLKVRNYEWTPEYHPTKVGEKKIGFIAQELETVFPALVSEHDIAPDNAIVEQLYGADDDTQYYVEGDEIPDGKSIGDVKAESQIPEGKAIGDVKVAAKDHEPTMRKAYKDAFTPILVKALQEVTIRLEAAEAKIATLESA